MSYLWDRKRIGFLLQKKWDKRPKTNIMQNLYEDISINL